MGAIGRRALTVAAATVSIAAGAALPASAGAAPSVLVVGDSLTVMAAPYLEQHLPGVRLTVNAENGYNSFQIHDLFEEAFEPSQSVIVFAAGTNDNPAHPEIIAGNLAAVAERVGNRCMVVPTVHGYTVDGVDNTGKNRAIRAFAASRPGTQVPDWAGFVARHPELMQADGLHPVAEGADALAGLIADGVLACLAQASASRAAPTPRLEEPPRMRRVSKLADRQASLLAAIGAAVAGEIAARLAGGEPTIAAAFAMARAPIADA